jgi:hypothetical protein
MMSFLIFGTSEKKNSAKRPATPANEAPVTPLIYVSHLSEGVESSPNNFTLVDLSGLHFVLRPFAPFAGLSSR